MPSGIPDNASVIQAKLSSILKFLIIFQLGLGILSLFIDLFSGMMILIGALILYLINRSKNWCTCVFYIVLCMMDVMTSTMLVGNYFAKHGRISSNSGIILFFTLVKFPFYTISCYYTFLFYRELKALFMEMTIGSFPQFQSAPSDQSRESAPHQAFSGAGYRIN